MDTGCFAGWFAGYKVEWDSQTSYFVSWKTNYRGGNHTIDYREEALFQENCNRFDERGVLKNIFLQKRVYMAFYMDLYGWNNRRKFDFTEKYPEIYEILPHFLHLGEKYPFLDMVIFIRMKMRIVVFHVQPLIMTILHLEIVNAGIAPPYLKKIKECRELRWYHATDYGKEYFRNWPWSHIRSDISGDVELTIWIHNGVTEVLFGDRAKEKFDEYNKMYSSKEYDTMFTSELYNYKSTCICNKEFVEKCFEYLGEPRSRVK